MLSPSLAVSGVRTAGEADGRSVTGGQRAARPQSDLGAGALRALDYSIASSARLRSEEVSHPAGGLIARLVPRGARNGCPRGVGAQSEMSYIERMLLLLAQALGFVIGGRVGCGRERGGIERSFGQKHHERRGVPDARRKLTRVVLQSLLIDPEQNKRPIGDELQVSAGDWWLHK